MLVLRVDGDPLRHEVGDDSRVAKLSGQVDAAEALPVLQIGIGAVLEEQHHHAYVSLPDGPMERRGHKLAAHGIHIRPNSQQVRHDLSTIVDSGPMQKTHVLLVGLVDIPPALHELSQPIECAVLRGLDGVEGGGVGLRRRLGVRLETNGGSRAVAVNGITCSRGLTIVVAVEGGVAAG